MPRRDDLHRSVLQGSFRVDWFCRCLRDRDDLMTTASSIVPPTRYSYHGCDRKEYRVQVLVRDNNVDQARIEEEDAARRPFPRDKAPQPLRKAFREESPGRGQKPFGAPESSPAKNYSARVYCR